MGAGHTRRKGGDYKDRGPCVNRPERAIVPLKDFARQF
jgi:hypothetical protein